MKLSIFWKVLSFILIVIAVLTASITYSVNHYVSQGFDEQALVQIKNFRQSVDAEIKDIGEMLSLTARLVAENPAVAQAMAEGDYAYLASVAKSMMKNSAIEFVTISDARGTVLARGHSERSGDSVANQINVQKALRGEASVGIEPGTVVKFSLRAGQPVVLAGRVVGVITPGVDLGSMSFVDGIKARIGVECTIFENDTRIATTIMRQGQRAVGTKMDNPAVIEAVLRNSREFIAQNLILGRMYDTAYWPIVSADGKTGGMLFIGAPREIVEQTEREIINAILIVSGIITLIVGVLAVLFARSLANPVRRASDFASDIAAGKLDGTLTIANKDEIGVLATSLNAMVKSLREMIATAETKTREAEEQAVLCKKASDEAEEAKRKAEQAKREGMLQAAGQIEVVVERMTSASEELSRQVEQAARGSERQSARVAETATAMEEMNATVMEVARNASQSAVDADKAKAQANQGETSVGQVIAAIGGLKTQTEALQTTMESLGRQAEGIGQIITVIEDIADQTNLLALNAAIEAARAGDAGRGFAVVADEVRKLAEKTMNATKEVGQAISAIQRDARSSVEATHAAAKSVGESTALAEQSGKALAEIVGIVGNTSGQVSSIAAAAEQQSATSEEINRSVDEISQISMETSQVMAEAASAITEMARQSQELQKLVHELKTQE